jgi:hypothetical protein
MRSGSSAKLRFLSRGLLTRPPDFEGALAELAFELLGFRRQALTFLAIVHYAQLEKVGKLIAKKLE